jgi:type III pantothenate kinase
VLAIDCGTATTLTLVDARGRLAGGAIAPGLTPCVDAVRHHTPRLPGFPVEWPASAIGRSTVESLQVGVVRGHVAMIRALAAEMAPGVPIVMTGGWSAMLADRVPGAVRHGNLTAWGGKVYWESCIRRTHQGG